LIAGAVATFPTADTMDRMLVSEATNTRPWDVAGPEDGGTLVLVHGALMSRAQWSPQVQRLTASGYRCISVDLPGHGALADQPFTLEGGVKVVIDAIDGLAGGRAILIGLSLGGYVSMAVAGRSPERVRGLVLAGATREPAGPIRAGFAIVGWAFRITPEVPLRLLARRAFNRRYGTEITTAILANGYFARGGSVAIRSLPGGGFRARLAAYGGPVLVINGDLDTVFRLGERRFLEGLPNVRRVVLRRAAHLSNLDQPDDFTAAVRSFAERLEA
jgi:pimeloyl-ACP methyl ester carboxylesterase